MNQRSAAPIDELRDTLSAFVAQAEGPVLLLTSFDEEVPTVVRVVDALDGSSPADLILFHAEPMTDVMTYVDGLVAAITAQVAEANDERADVGASPLSALPAGCHDRRVNPLDRMRFLLLHLETWLPEGEGNRVVLALLPDRIPDRAGHARILGAVIPTQGLASWPARLRLVLREDRNAPFVVDTLRRGGVRGIFLYTTRVTVNDFADHVAEQVSDTSMAPARRMNALLQCAYFDVGAGRFEAALDKFSALYTYYHQHNVPQLVATVLCGIGDVMQRIERWESAQEWMVRALEVATEARSLPLILQAASGLADLTMRVRAYQQADAAYLLASNAAGKIGNVFAQADMMEKCGLAREAQRDVRGSAIAWNAAAKIARDAVYDARLATVLGRLLGLARNAGYDPEARALQAELNDCRGRLTLQGAA